MDASLAHISKFVRLILRHDPGEIELTLDSKGWARLDLTLMDAKNG
jgi:RNA:NAD 2'-phosphotransferase (TPT1/KptA family)